MRQDIYQDVTNQIIRQLENGVQPWFRPWTVKGSALRPLRSNGQGYRGINVVLLWAAAMEKGYQGQHWFTYRQAEELGAQVRKGERGSMVVFAGAISRNETADDGEEIERNIPFLKQYKVFNADQIDNLPERFIVNQAEPLDEKQRNAEVEVFFAATGADIRHGGNRAFYRPSDDFIQMPDFERFKDEGFYYSTLAHEAVHWTNAAHRLDRKFDGDRRFGGNAYAIEELVAEMGAAFLAVDLGLYAEPRADHASYLQSWLDALKADKRAIFTAASHAQKAADYLHGLQPHAIAEAA